MLDRIRFVLIGTSHPGNIGAVARAMKTMGLADLRLVDPLCYPDAQATAMASGAADVLADASVHERLDDALEGCRLVLGTSARVRALAWPMISPREAALEMQAATASGPVALLFGREKSGLSNEELYRCGKLVYIPSNPDYNSLNLAMAVQIFAYELRMAATGEQMPLQVPDSPPASAEEQELFFRHLEEVITETGFLDPDNPRNLMPRLRRLFARAGLEQLEVNILRGILASVQVPKRRAGSAAAGKPRKA